MRLGKGLNCILRCWKKLSKTRLKDLGIGMIKYVCFINNQVNP
jgi:hypothetical protein